MVTGKVDNVSGGSVVGTTDGGRTWQQLATPPGVDALAAVACATAVICEVVGSGNGDAGAAYGTANGGQSWTTQPVVIGGGFFLGVACPSIDVCEATGNEGMIFGTVNGGASWMQQRVPPVPIWSTESRVLRQLRARRSATGSERSKLRTEGLTGRPRRCRHQCRN